MWEERDSVTFYVQLAPGKLAAQEVHMKERKINRGENKNQNKVTEIQSLSVNSSLTKFILTENK